MTQITFNIHKDNWKQILKEALSDFVLTREVKKCLEFRYKNSKITFRKEPNSFYCSSIKYSSLENNIFSFSLDSYKSACDIKFDKKNDRENFKRAWEFKLNMFSIELSAKLSSIMPVENVRLTDHLLTFDIYNFEYNLNLREISKPDLEMDLYENIFVSNTYKKLTTWTFFTNTISLKQFLELMSSEKCQESLKWISENFDKEKELTSEIDQLKKDLSWRESELNQIKTKRLTLLDF